MIATLRIHHARCITISNLIFLRQLNQKEFENTLTHVQSDETQTTAKVENQKDEKSNVTEDFPEEPTTCCMSGCANCVWLDYAEKISAYYRDGGVKAVDEIKKNVADQNILAFLLHELKMRQKPS